MKDAAFFYISDCCDEVGDASCLCISESTAIFDRAIHLVFQFYIIQGQAELLHDLVFMGVGIGVKCLNCELMLDNYKKTPKQLIEYLIFFLNFRDFHTGTN